jgi:hypothetical protein
MIGLSRKLRSGTAEKKTSPQGELIFSGFRIVLPYSIYVSARLINIISIHQELMCSIQFQFLLVFLDLPDGVFQSKVQK